MRRIAAHFGCLALFSTQAICGDIVLNDDGWQLSIDPSSLAMSALIDGEADVRVSDGGATHAATVKTATKTSADWSWDDGAYEFSARLDGNDLTVTIRANAEGELTIVRQPASAMGAALILPLGEGHYVPRGESTWRKYLVEQVATADTVEDLSLPLWGNTYGKHSLTWMAPDSFDNRLDFVSRGDAVTVDLTHRFTPLTMHEPIVLMLHLDRKTDDALAGARRYRRWLMDNGRFESLAEKIERTPGMQALPGATHVYLWGGLLATSDVSDWQAFGRTLLDDSPLASALRESMSEEARSLLPALERRPRHEKRALLDAVNEALASHARRQWMGDEPDMQKLADTYETIRQQVSELFANAVRQDAAQWGEWTKTIETLRDTGPRHLWLGHGQGWEQGLWHPESVATAVAAGFLIAPYDSYQTALEPGADAGWTTAHLGRHAFDRCAILRRNGTTQAGFVGKGHYTDPRCMRTVMQSRIAAIRAKVPYNSWFLDAYATGMSFESYRGGATMTRRQNVSGAVDNVRWMQGEERVPTGSEGGNALATGGLGFAHGMLTRVIAWNDPDMGQGKRKNRQSRYFLGNWYPASEPTLFFKAVPVKDTYRTVHFDPRYRLPLYQAVFHDSVIATHHWLYDNLKFVNARVERELTQLLYNVPGLYHLSADTLAHRLPAIRRQDAFFAPLHRRLATQALTRFEWLSEDRLLQRTTFADGTRLVANFSSEPRDADDERFPPHSVTSIAADGAVGRFDSH